MRYPNAVWRPLPENSTQRKITATQVIVHTAVDSPAASSLFPFFSRGDVGAESHFFVKRNGVVEQYMDTGVMANANRTADVRAISIETEDDGNPEGLPWTDSQLRALTDLIAWCCDTHRIPRSLCPAHDRPGLGWHSMFGFKDPIAQTGPLDNPWSSFRGKTCPGKTRIGQFLNTVVPALVAAPPPSTDDVGDAMNLIYVQDGDAWYLAGPAGVARIMDWNKVVFWRDVTKLKVVMMDPASFNAMCMPRLIGAML